MGESKRIKLKITIPEFDAMQWTGENTTEVLNWILANGHQAARFHEASAGVPVNGLRPFGGHPAYIAINFAGIAKGLSGIYEAHVTDWILHNSVGQFFVQTNEQKEQFFDEI